MDNWNRFLILNAEPSVSINKMKKGWQIVIDNWNQVSIFTAFLKPKCICIQTNVCLLCLPAKLI